MEASAQQKLMESAPYPAPWYFGKSKPKLIRAGKDLIWKSVDYGGVVLANESGNDYMLVSMGANILPAADQKSFLVWKRESERTDLNLYYYEMDSLQPMNNHDFKKLIIQMDKEGRGMHTELKPDAELFLNIDPEQETVKVDFPEQFKKFGEFIVITEMPGLYAGFQMSNEWYTTTMLHMNPEEGVVNNYPQDWFNQSNRDYLYEWISRAAIDPETNQIYGQGVRIFDFELDHTKRQCKK